MLEHAESTGRKGIMNIIEKKNALVSAVSELGHVKSIGQSGNLDEIPKSGESDIDLFVLCDELPDPDVRRAIYGLREELFAECRIQVCEDGPWGTGDVLIVDGVEVMFMYFTVREMRRYIDEVLAGKRLSNEGDFYPTGRVATVRNINVLYDECGDLQTLQDLTRTYPSALAKELFAYHAQRAIDEEDFGRALRRKDVLFCHQVLENALDHYLQALYALNRVYFPGRKRAEQHIGSFARKPADCYGRLVQVVRKGADANTIAQSVMEWRALLAELIEYQTSLDILSQLDILNA